MRDAGKPGFGGDGGPATAAALSTPMAVAVGADNALYIADTGNHRARTLDRDGVITTMAGSDLVGPSGDGAGAVDAGLIAPTALALTPDGTLYIAEDHTDVRRVRPDGTIDTVRGGDPSAFGQLGLATGPDGTLYVVDSRSGQVLGSMPTGPQCPSRVAGMRRIPARADRRWTPGWPPRSPAAYT